MQKSPENIPAGRRASPFGVTALSRHVSRRLHPRTLGLILVLALATIGCGGAGSPAAPTASPAPVGTTPPVTTTPTPQAGPPTVTVTAAGVSPLVITIDVGQQVTFVNNDSRPHDFSGGPDPSRPECREIDVAGFLVPGQSRETAPFPVSRTCVYHDHSMLGVAAFSGTIIIR